MKCMSFSYYRFIFTVNGEAAKKQRPICMQSLYYAQAKQYDYCFHCWPALMLRALKAYILHQRQLHTYGILTWSLCSRLVLKLTEWHLTRCRPTIFISYTYTLLELSDFPLTECPATPASSKPPFQIHSNQKIRTVSLYN